MARFDRVQVVVDLEQLKAPAVMGELRCQSGRGGQLLSFEYNNEWLPRPEAFAFDPDLALVRGAQYPAADRASFGIFLDSSPDRWGRLLMQRRENARARAEGRAPRNLTEWDFLLGVHDETRVGALRFREKEGEPYLEHDADFAAPPITSVRELEHASLNFEAHMNDEDHPEYARWLAQLYAPGTSLGGARPKAVVRDEQGQLCIAKFPSRQDIRDVGAWEYVAHLLATKAGIRVPSARILRLGQSEYATFLAKRFDRTVGAGRLAFVSAMTITQRTDGEDGASYLELVEQLQRQGVNTQADSEELFRRVVFSILIHNTDDHLRNHGFFIEPNGLVLSPAFDINPSVEGQELSLAINEVDRACDVKIALAAAKDYGLTAERAEEIVARVKAAVSTWRDEARGAGIPKGEQDLMAPAFVE